MNQRKDFMDILDYDNLWDCALARYGLLDLELAGTRDECRRKMIRSGMHSASNSAFCWLMAMCILHEAKDRSMFAPLDDGDCWELN